MHPKKNIYISFSYLNLIKVLFWCVELDFKKKIKLFPKTIFYSNSNSFRLVFFAIN